MKRLSNSGPRLLGASTYVLTTQNWPRPKGEAIPELANSELVSSESVDSHLGCRLLDASSGTIGPAPNKKGPPWKSFCLVFVIVVFYFLFIPLHVWFKGNAQPMSPFGIFTNSATHVTGPSRFGFGADTSRT